MGTADLAEIDSTEEYVCKNCRVICRQQNGTWVHPEPWATLKARQLCENPQPLRQAKPREMRSGSMRSFRRDRWINEEQLQQLVVPCGNAIEVGIVGCFRLRSTGSGHPRGWGYLASDGHYGFGATTTQSRFDGPGELAAETRALFWALRKLVPNYRVTLITDYAEIASMVDAWRCGDDTAMPPGYDAAMSEAGYERKLLLAARKVHENAESVAVRQVNDYADTALGAGANKLSLIGWEWCAGEITKADAKARALAVASGALDVAPLLVAGDDQAEETDDGNEEE
ncbi:hypothetical protein [Micromonospora sp. NPDC048839]|uniref:hypothetical protein n=1 Tax=Micromonospora sp. NPDC048839 TaxID=3155641 RepID=UPI0033F91EE8